MQKLWEHPDSSSTNIAAFRRRANKTYGLSLDDYHSLWSWSTENINDFWMLLWCFTKVVAQKHPTYAIKQTERGQLFPRPTWFPEARLNFAENILESPYALQRRDSVALVGLREGGSEAEELTLSDLRRRVARVSNALRDAGVAPGDRVACIGANSIDTLSVFLASVSIGAAFTSCSPETGEKGILDRFMQVRPKVLFADDWQLYNGKQISCLAKVKLVAERLSGDAGLQQLVVVPRFNDFSLTEKNASILTLSDFVADKSEKIIYHTCAFDDPLVIVYSSGTTGQPKCLVHSIGGVLLKQKLEQVLCTDMGPESRHLQYTTTNWIMYLYSVTGLLSGTKSILYDGSPTKPNASTLLNIISEQRVTHFGTSAPYLQLLEQSGITANNIPSLSSLRVITSTGSVLTESQYYWLYKTFGSVQLSSIAGGTDIAGAFVSGTPDLPVFAGWCQARVLGMGIQILSESGEAIEETGRAGELVCSSPFPSQPVFLWGDKEGKKYKETYFEKYHGLWTQGDFIRMDPKTKGIQFLGRSDGVLNPSGVRFGSAEIYNALASFTSVEDSLCIGQRRPTDTEERVLLFLKMASGSTFDNSLIDSIRKHIRGALSPRHVPAFVFETPEIPLTVNGKKAEIPVKKIVCGEDVTPSSTIANPQSLQWYKQFAWLDSKGRVRAEAKL